MAVQSTADSRPTVAIATHGCKLNQADSDVLASDFQRAGYRVVGEGERADVYVVNTCTVTHIADRKARQALRAARRRNPKATVVATGCYAQRSPEALRALAEVDLVAGNAGKKDIVRTVAEWKGDAPEPRVAGAEPPAVPPSASRTRAVIKIQEGCNQVCAYCIVPRVRGRERSVPPDVLVAQVKHRVSTGFNEVVLTGTQLGSYGFDIEGADLAGLVERVLSETDVARLRVSSLQPQEIDERLLGLWADPRLCPHFHLALQSGSDRVLKRMRRRYSSERYIEAVQTIRKTVPGVAITTDAIVGFPGESEEDFDETYALCEQVGFAAIHVFPYSARPGTSSYHFGEQVDAETRRERVRALVSLAGRLSAKFRDALSGEVRPVLWEGPRPVSGPDAWSGLTDNYVRVVARSQRPLANRITSARLGQREKDLVLAQVLS